MNLFETNQIDLNAYFPKNFVNVIVSDRRLLSLFLVKWLPSVALNVFASEKDRLNIEGAEVSVRTADQNGRFNLYPAYQKGKGRTVDQKSALDNANSLDFFLCVSALPNGILQYELKESLSSMLEEIEYEKISSVGRKRQSIHT